MAYTKTVWVNDTAPAIDQTNLNKIEQGIYDAHVTADGAVPKATFDPNTVLKADADNTPVALTVAEQRILGRLTGGVIAALTAAEARTLLDVSQTGDVVLKTLFDAYTILYADVDNIPAALTVAASSIVGRKSAGGIAAMTAAETKTLLAIDHGADVTGLGDDDHTQYLLVSGSRAMTGPLDMGANAIKCQQIYKNGTTGTLDLRGGNDFAASILLYAAGDNGHIIFRVPNSGATGWIEICEAYGKVADPFWLFSSDVYIQTGEKLSVNTIAEYTAAAGVSIDGLTLKDGGFALGSDADGDIYQRVGGVLTRLAKGTAKQIFSMNAGATAGEWRNQIPGEIVLTANGATIPLTAGCAAAVQIETTTNKVNRWVLDFDTATDENAEWSLVMPSDWNGGTITARFFWTCAAGVGGAAKTVCWALQGVCVGNDEAIDAAWGAAQSVTDTWIADGDMHVTAETAAITIANAGAGKEISFRVYRDVSADDLAGDARLMKVVVTFTRN